MDRDATTAITRLADDKTHVSRLRAPQIGIVALCLATSTKSSKSHLQVDLPKPDEADAGTDDFHFIPEKETLELRYEIDDPFGIVEEARLEVFTRFEDAAIYTLDVKKLGETWWAHGKHVVKWDGRIVKPTAAMEGTLEAGVRKHDLTTLAADKTVDDKRFPDGWVTLEHTPFKLRLTLVADTVLEDKPVTAWTYLQILIKSIELDLGPEEAVPKVGDDDRLALDKGVRKRIEDDGKLPAVGATRQVFLPSNLFKTNSNQMGTDSSFTRYQTLWDKGPNIPVVAKIRLADSNDAEVKLEESDKGAVALGNVRFLWDWEDADEAVDTANSEAEPRAYIKDAIAYYKDGTDASRSAKDHTYPKGDNCHKDRGGKRGPDADPVFPAQAGYDAKDTLDAASFPFKVELAPTATAPKVRLWSAYSRAWTKGKLKGQTGVVFQPSRMAGDDYKLTVYLAYDKTAKDAWTLDKKDEPLVVAEAIKKSTGTFRVWRELFIARYIRKVSSLGAFLPAQLGAVQALFRPAYVEVTDKMKATDSYALDDHRVGGTAPDYNAACELVLTGSGNALFTNQLATKTGADHASVGAAFKVQTYGGFVSAAHKHLNPAAPNDFGGGYTPQTLGAKNLAPLAPGPRFDRLNATKAWLTSQALATEQKYIRKLDEVMFPYAKKQLANALQVVLGSKDGGDGARAKNGIVILHYDNVHSAGAGGKLGSAIDPTDADGDTCVFLLTRSAVDTFVHEIGHHLFLAHAPTASGYKADTHDAAHAKCMMSYERPRLAFCGQCQLRLRGWKGSVLDKTGASNKKPP